MGLTVFDEDFGGFVPGVEVRGHLESVGSGIIKYEVVPFSYFIDGTVPGEGIGLADIADDGITPGLAVGIADVVDTMIGIVEHGADKVVEATVDADEGGGIGCLDDIDLSDEVAGFADEELAGLEPNLQGTAAGIGMTFEGLGYFLGEQLDIGFRVAVFIRDFEPAAKVDEFQVIEPGDQIEEDLDAFDEDVGIYDLAACMDMEIGYFQLIFFDEAQHLFDLVDGDAELAFIMTGGDLEIAACHDARAKPDANGMGRAEFPAEFFEVREAIDVDDDTEGLGLFDLVEADAIGGIEYPFRREAGMEGELHFIDGAAIDVCAEIADVP